MNPRPIWLYVDADTQLDAEQFVAILAVSYPESFAAGALLRPRAVGVHARHPDPGREDV